MNQIGNWTSRATANRIANRYARAGWAIAMRREQSSFRTNVFIYYVLIAEAK